MASALDCGTALVLIVPSARRAGYLALDQGHVANLAKMLAVFVLVDLYFYACDLLTSGYFGGEAPKSCDAHPPARFPPVFWTQVALMAVSVAIPRRAEAAHDPRRRRGVRPRDPRRVLQAPADSRGRLPDSEPDMPGVTTQYAITNWQAGFTGAYQGMVYAPQPIEFGVTLGVLAMFCSCCWG